MSAKRFCVFGPFRLDALKRLLLREGQVLHLAPRGFDTLLALVRSAGEVLTKEELMRRVWPDTVVEENNLTVIISGLRKILGETCEEHSYIVTIPSIGYRFVAQIEELSLEEFQKRSQVATAVGAHERQVREMKAATDTSIRSIAVLPFKPLGQGCEPYLGLGLADSLITRLGSLRQITVRPTSAILKYASPRQDPLAAGRALGVDSVLDAHFQIMEERIRLTAQFMRLCDGAQLWSERIDEKFTNLFAVQDTLSERLADALMLKLNKNEKERLTRRYTENSEAYRAYLYGRYFFNKRTASGLKRAIAYFNQACAIDPSDALAYAGLADCYSLFGFYAIQTFVESLPNARTAALEALRLDDALAEAHASLGLVSALYDWNWAAAEREYERAIEINPNYPTAHQWYGEYLAAIGRHQEAQDELKRALDLDPLSLVANAVSGFILYLRRRYEESIAQLEKTLELDSEFWLARRFLSWSLAASGRYQDAISQVQKTKKSSDANILLLAELGYLYAVSGNRSQVQRVLAQMREHSKGRYVPSFSLAVIAAARGRITESFEALNHAVEERTYDLIYLVQDPKLDPLRDDPRFAALLRAISLPVSNK